MSIEREKMKEEISKETEETQKLLRLKAGYNQHTSPILPKIRLILAALVKLQSN